MANEKRLIDANALEGEAICIYSYGGTRYIPLWALRKAPTVDAVELPCKLGDKVWAIRCFRGVLVPQAGEVSEMFFCGDMRLCIVVKHIARGEWGKTVFGTAEEAMAAIEKRSLKE